MELTDHIISKCAMNRLQRFAELDGTTDSVRSFQERVLEGVDFKTKNFSSSFLAALCGAYG